MESMGLVLISGEHGIGADKRCYLDWMFTPDDLATMSLLRRAFDPQGRANPEKVFPTPRTCGESVRRKLLLKQENENLSSSVSLF